jgi:phospholipase C
VRPAGRPPARSIRQAEPMAAGVAHVVVFVQENHTTDNYFRSMRAWGANVAADW